MKRFFGLILISFIARVYAYDVIDDSGATIHIDKPATRIVSLAPDVTETLFAIGAGQHVVGVISGSDYPASAKQIPQVGSYSGLDLERIIALQPDLVIVWGQTFAKQITILKKMGILVYIEEPKQLEDIPKTMDKLSILTGRQAIAKPIIQQFNNRLEALRHRAQPKSITVFYQLGDYSLMTINKDSWINQVISLCGGRNIFENAKTAAPAVDWEAVVVANPQIIISDSSNPDWKKQWQHWPEMSAVKNKQLFTIPPDLIERAGPRLIEGATQICRLLTKVEI